jgi:ubiquinone/menaquinone biosynthesis C-methylase UbiE
MTCRQPPQLDYRPFPNEGSRNWRQEHIEIPLMLRTLGLPRGGRVLEIGCGRGVALPALAQHLAPARLVGLDIDRSLIEQAVRRVRTTAIRAELVAGDVRQLPFPDRHFDLVIDFGTCFHIARADEALREVSRILAAGGIFATETKLNQLFSHPVRSRGRVIPWSAAAALAPRSHAGLWQSRWRHQ